MSLLLQRIRTHLGLDAQRHTELDTAPSPVPLPSRLATGDLAWASVCAVLLATGAPVVESPDPGRIAAAYRSDRLLRINGVAPDVWAPLSGFHHTSDGWVRTHANYPHHAAALRSALGIDEKADQASIDAAFAACDTASLVTRISAAGGLAVAVRAEDRTEDATLRRSPVVELGDLGPGREASLGIASSLRGVRVLDLTRVIAGPVCTRTLAALGAEVLRVDPPHLREPEWQHLDTGHGKRSALLDASSERFSELLARADVVVLGYSPAGLDRLGLSPDSLAERHPGLVVAQLSAWGVSQPERRGFDSLVQAASGIALVESLDGETPGVLPAQALDHSAGYLLAAGIYAALRRRAGRTFLVRTSLRRIAAELLGMPRSPEAGAPEADDPALHAEDFSVGGRTVTTARSALPGHPFSAPRPWGQDDASW